MTHQHTPRIAIIGGGPGGLTLARILQRRGIQTTVFEKEHDPNARPQGGTLDLHPESGQYAVHLAGLDDEFRAIARYEDQDGRFLAKNSLPLLEMSGDDDRKDRPEVDRTALRAMLLDSLDPGVVRWGHGLRSAHPLGDGQHELTFDNGMTETFDLVVGADGAWSRVRPLVSSAVPTYTGVIFIEFGLDNVDTDHPALAKLVGHGSMFALAESKGLIAQRNGHAHVRVYAAMRVPEKWDIEHGFEANTPAKAREWLLDQFEGWGENLRDLIRESNDRFVSRPLYMLPVGHRWDFRPGVTLLGDAAHLMSPFSGEGVNLAMADAADLAVAISASASLDDALRAYESPMLARAAVAAREADEGLTHAIAADAPAGTLAYFHEFVQQQGSN